MATVWRRCGDGVATVWQRCGDGVATVWRRCGFSDASVRLIALLHLLILGQCYAVHINASSLYNESVHRKKQHTRGSNTIPYKLARLVTCESMKWKYSIATNVLIVYEIRLNAIREVSPPFGEEHCGLEQDISFPANKRGTQLWNSESL